MILLGVELKRPTFWRATCAVGFAVALWAMLTLSPLGAKDAAGAGANLAAIVFGCLSNELGIEVRRGGWHLVLNILGCVLVLVAYRAAAALF